MKHQLFIHLCAFVVSLVLAGCGQTAEEFCQNMCSRLAVCAEVDDPDVTAACVEVCVEDIEEEPECAQAVEDIAVCLEQYICVDINNQVACRVEFTARTEVCPSA